MEGVEFGLGFIAGEASFGLNTRKASNGKWYCRPYFKIGLNSKDGEILHELKSVFGDAGRVQEKRKGQVVVWEIESSDDLSTFVSIVDQHDSSDVWHVAEKKETYETWEKIVEIYTENNQTGDQERVEMLSIAEEGKLNFGAGRQEKDYQSIIEWYKENHSVYPTNRSN